VIAFLLRRVMQGAAIVFAVATLAFVLLHLAPGDPFSATLDDPRIAQSTRDQLRANYGLDRPLPEQYARYLVRVARGDFGPSYSHNRPVADVLRAAIPNTLLLMGTALVASLLLGVGIGVLQALRRGRAADRALGAGSLVVASVPDFWLALLVMLGLAYWLPIFPISGTVTEVLYDFMSPLERLADRLRHLALPALTLTLVMTATIARYQRAALLEVLPEDYVRTARAKGLDERAVVLRHALRNALLPVITIIGLAFPTLLGGAVFVEQVFSWPGMGRVAVAAFGARDYPLVLAEVIVGGMLVVVGGIIADLLYAAADPRLRAAMR
jgi:peptide/nickel transport system permease protein